MREVSPQVPTEVVWLRARAYQLGSVNPGSAFSCSAAAAAATRHGVLGWLLSLSTMQIATSGCSFSTIGLAQKADGLVGTALLRPSPPMAIGRDAVFLATSSHLLFGTPKM